MGSKGRKGKHFTDAVLHENPGGVGARNLRPPAIVVRALHRVPPPDTHMHPGQRPSRRDWVAAITLGAALGLVVLGVGSRVGMRVVALNEGQSPGFTFEGTMTVVFLGACAGAAAGAIFALARAVSPTRQWVQSLIFWGATLALMLRGLNPVTPFKAALFLPLMAVHGVLLHVLWRRRRGREDPHAAPLLHGER